MTTMPRSLTDSNRLSRLLTFLSTFLLALLGSSIALGAGWYLATRTLTTAQLSAILGISTKTPWYLSRSSGTVAYLLLAGSTIWGLLLSTKIIKDTVPAALSLAMHNILSWMSLIFTGVHALALLFDNYYIYTIPDLAIPFIGPYRPGWVALGIIGFYLMCLTTISFSVRKQIGHKRWRQLHYLTFLAYVLVTIHGFTAGTDSGNPGMKFLYLGSGLIVFFLSNYRLLTSRTSGLGKNASKTTNMCISR